MKQVKLHGLVIHEGPDDVVLEYVAGLIRQISDDPQTTALAASVARGEREAAPINWDATLFIEDTTTETTGTWTLAPTGVWQSTLQSLEMIAKAVRQYDRDDLSADEFVEAVREQIGDV